MTGARLAPAEQRRLRRRLPRAPACTIVDALEGKVNIKVPAGTQAGKIFRLKGKGFPALQSYGRGDQLIHVNVWTPKTLSAEEKKMMEKLRTLANFEPNPGKSEKGFFHRMKEFFQ